MCRAGHRCLWLRSRHKAAGRGDTQVRRKGLSLPASAIISLFTLPKDTPSNCSKCRSDDGRDGLGGGGGVDDGVLSFS